MAWNPALRRIGPTAGAVCIGVASLLLGVSVLAGCAGSTGDRVVARRSTGAPTSGHRSSAQRRVRARSEAVRLRAPTTLLAQKGFVLVAARNEEGPLGNAVHLDRYAGPEVVAPDGSRRGRADLAFNTARVVGLEDKVRSNLDEFVALDRRVDPEGLLEVTEVEVRGRPGLFVRQGVGRFVVTAAGDWRIQVSTGTPTYALSDDALLEIADKAQVR